MRHYPRKNHYRYPDKSENHPQRLLIIRSKDDVVHVSSKSGHHDKRDVDDQKRHVTDQQNKME